MDFADRIRHLTDTDSTVQIKRLLKIHAIDYKSVKLTPESECVRFLLEYGAAVQTFKFPVATLTEIAIPENTALYEAIAKVEEPGFRPAYVKIDELNGELRVEILTAEERWNFFPTTKRCVVLHLVNLREITSAVTDSKWLGSIENMGPTLEEIRNVKQ
jgi:hypothetical protein